MTRFSPRKRREAGVRAPGAAAAPPDFLGRTALPLLAALPLGARVLFLLDPSHALLNRGGVAEARFFCLAISGADLLPFRDQAFECVVVDTQLVSTAHRTAADDGCGAIIDEARRVLTRDGQLVVSFSRGRMPPRLRALGAGWLKPAGLPWEDAIERTGFEIRERYLGCTDGLRLTRITRTKKPGAAGLSATTAAVGLARCVRRGQSSGPAVIDTILNRVRAEVTADASPTFDAPPLAIRKIGKSAVRVAAPFGRDYLVRIPRSRIAVERARANFAALEALHSNQALSPRIRALVPRGVLSASAGDYPFFVEELLEGAEPTAAAWRASDGIWQPDAVEFITGLHRTTARPTVMDADRCERFVRTPIRRIREVCGGQGRGGVLEWIAGLIESHLLGQTVSLTWTHGDYFLGNCLYDATGSLTAVVDWELSSREGLPLLDLLHCMRIAGETSSHPTWQRFSAIHAMLRSPRRVSSSSVLSAYVGALEIPARVVPALLALYWVDHIACRIEARSADVVWMNKRVYQPLRVFAGMQRTGGPGDSGT